jgi:hypothetical protein
MNMIQVMAGELADMREERDRLKKALEWALDNGISANDWGERKPYTFKNKGCGCCSYEEDVPEDIAAVVDEIARVVVEKQNAAEIIRQRGKA